MYRIILNIFIFCLVIIIVLPSLIVRGLNWKLGQSELIISKLPVSVYSTKTHKITKMDIEEYVQGVVAAEMPANFELEALKAQAVTARTYILNRMRLFGGKGSELNPEADVTNDPRFDQAWLTREELEQKWGVINYFRYWGKVTRAVKETEGMVLTYDGKPIDAVYHSTCGGKQTESALNAWGKEIPYLHSVKCTYCRQAKRLKEVKNLSLQQVDRKLGTTLATAAVYNGRSISVNGMQQLFKVIERTSTGRIKEISVQGKTFTGIKMRELLGLRSTQFQFEPSKNGIKIVTYGSGHGVGLCQYGADGLAKTGKGYMDILNYYFTGVKVKKIKDN